MSWRRRRTRISEQPTSAPHPEPAPGVPYDRDEEELFAFFEDCMQGAVETCPLAEQAGAVSRALELANDDWPEQDAVRELLQLVDGERRVLERTQRVLQGGLLRTMVPNIQGIRASRLLHATLRDSHTSDG